MPNTLFFVGFSAWWWWVSTSHEGRSLALTSMAKTYPSLPIISVSMTDHSIPTLDHGVSMLRWSLAVVVVAVVVVVVEFWPYYSATLAWNWGCYPIKFTWCFSLSFLAFLCSSLCCSAFVCFLLAFYFIACLLVFLLALCLLRELAKNSLGFASTAASATPRHVVCCCVFNVFLLMCSPLLCGVVVVCFLCFLSFC